MMPGVSTAQDTQATAIVETEIHTVQEGPPHARSGPLLLRLCNLTKESPQNGSGGSKAVYKQLQITESALVQMRSGSGVREPSGTVRAGLTFELGGVSSEL